MAEIRLLRLKNKQGNESNSNNYWTVALNELGVLGGFSFHYNSKDHIWELESLDVDQTQRRRGIGKMLLEDFANRHPHQRVHGTIDHDDTYILLAYRYSSLLPGESILVPKKDLKQIPIAKVLRSGNINVEQIKVERFLEPDPEKPHLLYGIEFWGKTAAH